VAIIEKEIDILLKLDHPNVIKLLDFKKTSNHYYLVFEFCEYGDLDQYIRKNTEHHKLPESEVRGIIQ
jgi:serine/threonine-protein kinase ULK/ATG1